MSEMVPAFQFESPEQQRVAAAFGMWVFLATEVLFFGALFVAYLLYHHIYGPAFDAAGRHLNPLLGGINSALLLTSSLTMTLAEQSSRLGRRWLLSLMLAASAALGTAFLAIKAVEYRREFHEGLVPLFGLEFRLPENAPQGKLFFHFYFLLTGLHAVHLLVGIGLAVWLLGLALRHRHELETRLTVSGLYWHFVDVVWIFLFALLYLAPRHG